MVRKKKVVRKRGEKMKKINKIGSCFLAVIVLFAFTSIVIADVSNIEVTWYVPGDTSFSYDLAGAETEIVFAPSGQNFNNQSMRSQTSAIPGLNISNDGNKAIKINATFADAWYASGIANFNMSIAPTDNSTRNYWTNANETTSNQTIASSIAQGSYEEWWIWSSGTGVTESAEGADKSTFRLTSSSA